MHTPKSHKIRLFEFLKLKIGIYPDFTFSFKPADEEKTFGLSEKPLHDFFPERSARRSFHPHPKETHVGALMPADPMSARRYEGLRNAVLPFFLRKSPFLRVFRSSEAKKGGGKRFRRKGYPLRRLRPVFSGVLSFRNLNVLHIRTAATAPTSREIIQGIAYLPISFPIFSVSRQEPSLFSIYFIPPKQIKRRKS